MTSSGKIHIDIDDEFELRSYDIIPEGLDDEQLPGVLDTVGNTLSYHTTLALIQIELEESDWDNIKVSQIRARHNNKHDPDTYRQKLIKLADIGFLRHRKVGNTHEFKLADECEPADIFGNDNIIFDGAKTAEGRFGPLKIVTDLLPEWFENQYVSVGEFILTVVVVNLLLLLVAGTFGPISESEPRVIFAWALLSFGISAFAVGSVLLIIQRLQGPLD